MASPPSKPNPKDLVVLPCSGLDKEAGSASRELALILEEKGAKIICPVLFRHSQERYAKDIGTGNLLVIDGCKTGCATRLAAEHGLKIARKLNITEALRSMGSRPGKNLRLSDNISNLLPSIAQEILEQMYSTQVVHAADDVFRKNVTYREFSIDKFVFRVPESDYFFNENDCWARVSENLARIGISDYLQQRISDIILFEPPKVGTEIDIFNEAGSLETTKIAIDIISPFSGKVVAVNQEVVEMPEIINQDPYERGWTVELELYDRDSEIELLMDCDTYFDYVKNKAEREYKELYGS